MSRTVVRSLKRVVGLFGFGKVISALNVVAAMIVLFMMIAVVSDITYRTIARRSIPGVLEITEYLLVAVIFLGLAYTQRAGANVKMELLISRIHGLPKAIVRFLTLVASLAICGLLTWRTTLQAIASIEIQEYRWGIVQIPMWPVKILLPVGFALLCVQLMIEVYQERKNLKRQS